MLGKLAYRNTKRNIKDYMIYLITVTVSFSLIFAFNLVASSDEIVKLCSSMDAFKNSLFAVNILIVFVICFLINYTTKFMFEKRSKELGEYYGAAEPPVRCGESHLSGLTEPPHFVY